MGEFKKTAEKILSELEAIKSKINDRSEGLKDNPNLDELSQLLKGDNLPAIVETACNQGRDSFNCYPGLPGAGCHKTSFFIALQSNSYVKGRSHGHIDFNMAMEKMVQHMQGYCHGSTKCAVLMTDSWNVASFEKWHSNIKTMQKEGNLIECYLFSGGQVSEIKI